MRDSAVAFAVAPDDREERTTFADLVSTSETLRSVFRAAEQVAPTDATVLLRGETGVGKEVIAAAIQRHSRRARRPFVRVNCAAIPASLIAAELFGHERGAFTGASQKRIGRFEMANGGTILLDEIGELPLETQVALLRVLQEGEIERLGGSPVRVDVRVIAATNRALEQAVAEGTFRADLFYRLDVFPIWIPPLRERGDDVLLLAEQFLADHARRLGKSFVAIDDETRRLLRAHSWPGNVRELQNVIERGVILCAGPVFSLRGIWTADGARRATTAAASATVVAPASASAPAPAVLAAHERELIEDALRACGGRVAGADGAARRLGLPPSTLESKIVRYAIDKRRFRDVARANAIAP